MGRRRKYTEEERAARDAADAAIRNGAAELLKDPEAVAVMVSRLMTMTPASPKLLRYSLRNTAMLIRQAADRGMELTDVDSIRGWNDRGRSVRMGEQGLRIVVPKGTEAAEETDADTAELSANTVEQGDEADAGALRTRFRMRSVFDISQTQGVEDFDAVEPKPITDPAPVLRETLTEQIERMGYTIQESNDADGPATVDGADVTVPAGQPVPELARALAVIVNLPKADRPKPDPATERAAKSSSDAGRMTQNQAGDGRTRLSLGDGYGTASVTVETDWTTGRTYYTVKAPRVSGTWTVHSAEAASCDTVANIAVDYGRDDGRQWYGYGRQDRPDRPTINGIRVTGGTHGIDPASIDTLDRRRITCHRMTGPSTSCSAPGPTNERMAAVVRAILHHWLARPDLAEVHRACARHEAPERMHEADRTAGRLNDQIAALTAERDQLTAQSDHFRQVAADTEQIPLFASTT